MADFLAIETGKVIHVDTIRHIIGRLPCLNTIGGVPFEAYRLECDPVSIERYFEDLERILVDFPCAMVINLDETGHCDWVEARIESVVVPVSSPNAQIPIPVKRQTNRSTLLAGIAADGNQLTPLVLIHRHPIETELYESELTPELVMFRHQENGLITTDLFNEWTREVLFPYFEQAGAALLGMVQDW
jgi:hypothetical protein